MSTKKEIDWRVNRVYNFAIKAIKTEKTSDYDRLVNILSSKGSIKKVLRKSTLTEILYRIIKENNLSRDSIIDMICALVCEAIRKKQREKELSKNNRNNKKKLLMKDFKITNPEVNNE